MRMDARGKGGAPRFGSIAQPLRFIDVGANQQTMLNARIKGVSQDLISLIT